MWLRPSLRGITEREVRTALPSTAAGKDTNRPWTMRHHYAVGLEACDTSTLNKLQAAFINVFTAMSDTLSSASALCDPTLSAYVMWTWGCDVGTRDHEFLLRSGILPLLASKFSLDAILDEKAHAEAVDSNRSASSSAARPSWKPWRLDDIRTGLLSGWLSKHQVLVHILAAPISAIVVDTGVTPLSAASASAAGGPSDQGKMLLETPAVNLCIVSRDCPHVFETDRLSEWRKSNGLDDVNAAAIKMTVEELLLLLSTFACYQPPAVPSAAGVAVGATDLSTDVVFASSVAAVEDLTTAGATPFKPKRKKAPRIRYSFRHQDHEHDLRRYVFAHNTHRFSCVLLTAPPAPVCVCVCVPGLHPRCVCL